MITKYLWKGMLFELKWAKKHNIDEGEKLVDFFLLTSLITFTPLILLIDLLLFPFEITYYCFCKWLEKGEKNERRKHTYLSKLCRYLFKIS